MVYYETVLIEIAQLVQFDSGGDTGEYISRLPFKNSYL